MMMSSEDFSSHQKSARKIPAGLPVVHELHGSTLLAAEISLHSNSMLIHSPCNMTLANKMPRRAASLLLGLSDIVNISLEVSQGGLCRHRIDH